MSAIQKGLFLAILFWFLIGCGSDRFDVDVSGVVIDQEQVRIDKILVEQAEMKVNHEQLLADHPLMYRDYFEEILRLGEVNQPRAFDNMLGFISDPMMSDIQAEINKSFEMDEIYVEEFNLAFKHYRYYFPNEIIPNITFYNSGFNYGIYPTPEFIGIGLEWYIGKDNELLERLPPSQFPKYLKNKMQPEYIVSDAMRGYLLVKYSDKIDGKELINQLVYFGKIAYMMNAFLPFADDYLNYGYQPKQLEWCEKNEFLIWKTLVNEELLYTKDGKLINGFIGNAPFTKGFSDQSPGKLAYFIGKVMIEDYLDVNPEVSFEELLEVSSRDVLKAYRPSK